jgi:transcriptional regulator with XRE-family HTH domain
MTLKDWLTAHKMSNAEFARVSGIGQRALVQKYRHGRQTPSFENLERIRVATAGLVMANDFAAQRRAATTFVASPANDTAKSTSPKRSPTPVKPAPKPKRPTRSAGAAASSPSDEPVQNAA